jgi:ABC-type dipeptide/oligopeptide/nickel transport system permease subunit
MSDHPKTDQDRAEARHRDIEFSDADVPLGADTDVERDEPGTGPAASLWGDAWRELRTNPIFVISAILIVVMLVMAVFPRAFLFFYDGQPANDCNLAYSVNNPNAPGLGRPTATNWFGFDLQGCDYYVKTIRGARISIFIGLLVTAGAVILALLGGSAAGYYGGLTDSIIARLTDIWFAIPTILGAIVLLTTFGERGMVQVALVLVLLGWPSMLRLMRSSVISTKEVDYVAASRALGANDLRLITKHILPNAIAPVIVYATIYVGVIISAEAALSFLGVGVQLPAISWGLMINTAQSRILQAPHLLFFPGVFLAITVLSFILMGDALRDALDPKLR